jgi:hypothetical protein
VVDQPRIDILRAYIDSTKVPMSVATLSGRFWTVSSEWGSGYSERFGLVYVDYPCAAAKSQKHPFIVTGSLSKPPYRLAGEKYGAFLGPMRPCGSCLARASDTHRGLGVAAHFNGRTGV